MEGVEGANLLDTLNDQNMKDLSVFGICDKQLACHSWRVNIIKQRQPNAFPPISEDEQDVLDELGNLYKQG